MFTGFETMADTLCPFINKSDGEAVAALYALDRHIDGLERELAQCGAAYDEACRRAEKAERELVELKASLFDAGWHKPQPLDF